MKKFLLSFIFIIAVNFAFPQNAWINEFHYDNTGGDVDEFIEIVIEDPGSWTLSNFQVNLYNGSNGTSYGSQTVDNFFVGSTNGNFTFYYWEYAGIQNGAPDGLALSYSGSVIPGQFLSYEGTFTAADGPAIGILSTDIGVLENGSDPVGYSLQLGGAGTQYSDFFWNAPAPETKGIVNTGQTFSSGTTSTINVVPPLLSGFSYIEGGGPSSSQSYELSGSDLTPVSGNITVTGSVDYEVSSDDITFGPNLTVPYVGGTLSATPIYVRLKSGLPLSVYDGETIGNEGGGAPAQTVLCNGAVINPEPTNHVTDFTAVLGNPDYYYNNLSWTDAAGGTEPDGYLIKRSYIDFSDILDPVDGIPESNTFSEQNIDQGVQSAVFTGFAGSTYYYKIFPYTNSGPFIDYKTDGVPQFSITNANAPSLPINENFEYATGSNLTDNGWLAHSGAGTNPIIVQDNALIYPDYINSGLGKSVTLNGTGEDDNRAFDSVYSGSIYASFMVSFDSTKTDAVYFFHFGPENSTSTFRGKIFIQNDGTGNLAFGVSKSSNTATFTPFSYSLNTTYLIVIKYTFNTGSTTDDEVKLWIDPVLNGIEPVSDLTQTDTGNDPTSLGFFALRQGFNGPGLVLGGLRVADTWVPEAGTTTFALSVPIADGWNVTSVPGTNPDGMGVDNWWINHTGTVYKFVPGSGYSGITTTTPGEGYWMKNAGAETYSYPAIEIVTHDPIDATTGWNMFGGFENSVDPAALTTTPAGQIVYPIYKFVPGTGYAAATSIDAGYGYWIKVASDCQINVPNALAKGNNKVATDYLKDDWGRITVTDATGSSYTLYAVKGQVDLNKYELPPLPPAGVFDVRYSDGRIAEDINSDFQTIDMSGVKYPVKVRVENIDIRLQDVTGKEINVNVKSGEEVSIGNSAINKLMVSGQLIPDKYALEQNYPNPFNPSTTIEFSLPENVKNVKLTIYNVLGQKITELVNTSLDAGKYVYQWNAKNVATGLYIYELRTDKFVSVKKMMLMK